MACRCRPVASPTSSGLTPADSLLSQQDPSGAFLFSGSPNLYSTQNTVRALAGEAFSAEPPRRAAAGDPRWRPLPAVAEGTATPHALAIDDGAGAVRFCSVTVAGGATLAAVLDAAPCVDEFVAAGGSVTEVNGREGAWRVRRDRAPEGPAADGKVVAFGDTVALRLPASAGGEGPAGPTGASGPQGPAGSAGQSGPAGTPGPVGPAGPKGATGTTGARGPKGSRGKRGRRGPAGRVTCRVRSRRQVVCRVTSARRWRATLTRHGRVYARGTAARLHARRAVRPGRYTLRVGGRRLSVRVA